MMTISRKGLLLLIVGLALISVPCRGLELYKAGTKLKFESVSEKQQWLVGGNKFGKGPIKPSYVAEFYIRNLPMERYKSRSGLKYRAISNFSSYGAIKGLLETSGGESMSEPQRDLVTTGDVVCQIGKFAEVVGNHAHFRLYGVTGEDAKATAEGFVDFLIGRANKNLAPLLIEERELKKKIVEKKANIDKTEAKLKTVRAELDELKKTSHYVSGDEAKNSISKLNGTIDELNIKLASLRAKQKMTNRALQEEEMKKSLQGGDLERKVVELTNELEAARAMNETAATVRNRTISSLKAAQGKLDTLKRMIYNLSDTKAKGTLLDLYKTIDDFIVIFNAVRLELEAADETGAEETKSTEPDTEFKLERRLREETAELEGIEASKEAAAALREQAKRFYYLAEQVSELEKRKKSLGDELVSCESALGQIEEKLSDPGPELLRPEVYQNKVTIYPVQSGFTF